MAEPRESSFDRRFAAAAIRLGAGALGATWPNPAVGAIVVKDGEVVGRARTAAGGRPHAETIALAAAGAAARGATLYVSLEPCSHHGRTPPCTEAIIAAGIARVVAPAEDPDPRVAGGGLERLRAAGIDVALGTLADEARRAQAGHFRRMATGRPHVLLKLAVSADDAIGRKGEGNVAITGERARRHVQALRSRCDAILVGRRTVEADDPQLTCRLPGLEHRSPVRVVLDTEGQLGEHHRIFDQAAPTWILTANEQRAEGGRSTTSPSTGRLPGAPKGALQVRSLRAPRSPMGGLDLAACLARLGAEGITRLLIEGGAHVARSILETDLADEIMLFRSSYRLGGDLMPAPSGLPLPTIEKADRYRIVERRMFGTDRMTRYLRAP